MNRRSVARDVVALAREGSAVTVPLPIHVFGPSAHALAAALAVGGEPALVRVAASARGAAAVVALIEGDPDDQVVAVLRTATRAGVPTVAVTDRPDRVPYVLAEHVVHRGGDSVVDDVVERLAAALGFRGAALAAGLPVLRDAVVRHSSGAAAARAAWLGWRGPHDGSRISRLAMLQSRLLRSVTAARGARPPRAGREALATTALEWGAAAATGVAIRGIVRVLPRSRIVAALVAYWTTRLLGAAARAIR